MPTPLRPVALSLAAALLFGAGCAPEPTCSSQPDEDIIGFQVTVETGSDATDADIFFCITRVTDAARDCVQLGIEGVDDFDSGSTEDYTVDLAVDAGDLDRLWIENRGDAPLLSNDGDDWMLQALRVVALTASGSTELVDAPLVAERVYDGDEYEPACTY